ncbi:MAG: RlmE family RNA methyltransferase [Sphingomonadales bacterium]
MSGRKSGGGKPHGRARRDPKSVARGPKVRVKTARNRTVSSTRWLQRQLNDPYVAAARQEGYRSRAAFKLIEINDKFSLLKGACRVVDLGAAPGGWTQVVVESTGGQARVVGIDLLEVDALPGATMLTMDFLAHEAEQRLMAELDGPADVVLSDMAATTTGHRQTDHLRTMALCEAAFDFACKVLRPGGNFVAKVLRGGTEGGLLDAMKQRFTTVRHVKPPASRSGSTEMYVVGLGFKAGDASEGGDISTIGR